MTGSDTVSPASTTVSGKGTLAVSSPASLIVTVAHFPLVYGNGNANPQNVYDIALLVPGDANGWYPAIPVSQNPMRIPMPPGCTSLGYSCLGGSQLTIAEVAASVPNWQKPYYDRNPRAVGNSLQEVLTPPTNLARTVIYTVPANRLLLLSWFEVEVVHNAAPTTPSVVVGYGYVNGALILQQALLYNSNFVPNIDRFDGAGVVLVAGNAIEIAGTNYETTGQVFMFFNWAGTEFDA